MLQIAGGILLALFIIMLLPILIDMGIFLLAVIGIIIPPIIALIVAPEYSTPIIVIYIIGLYIWSKL